MALTKKPFARYKLIDQFLKRNRGVTIRELTEMVNEELRLMEDNGNSEQSKKFQVSERMIRNDVEDMQEIYPVAIVKRGGKYYYEEQTDSIDNINLTEQDKTSISLALNIFSRFKGTPLFEKFSDAITRILSSSVIRRINTSDTAKYIQLAETNAASGIEWVEKIYDAIVEKKVLRLHYKNFGEKESAKIISPYMLKEYRNKWYMLAYSSGNNKPGLTVPYRLSRIINIEETNELFVEDQSFDGNKYFKYAIGVLPKHDEEPVNVKLKITGKGMIKLISEDKIHSTQEIIPISDEEIQVELRVYNTSELQTYILSYGEYIEVLEPVVLREKIIERINKSISKYL
jgi:predicted DNA-binding transcriptional regulator YafY